MAICQALEEDWNLWEAYQELLQAGVIVRPVANYGMPNHLRISIGLEQENKKFIHELGRILAA